MNLYDSENGRKTDQTVGGIATSLCGTNWFSGCGETKCFCYRTSSELAFLLVAIWLCFPHNQVIDESSKPKITSLLADVGILGPPQFNVNVARTLHEC